MHAAREMTGGKPVFLFYEAAVELALGQTKEALVKLETAMTVAPRLVKKIIELNPAILQQQAVVDILARFKRRKSI